MVIKSISFSNTEILNNINKLYLSNKGFELDPTYSKGNFYKNFPKPRYISDLEPKFEYVEKADCTKLKYNTNSIESICFDPPFLFGTGGNRDKNISSKRFSILPNHNALINLYSNSLIEFYRILKPKGILAFKCQDFTDGKTYFVHNEVYNLAIQNNFKPIDLFILLAKIRIYNPNLKQRHSRKFHCYWYIFKK